MKKIVMALLLAAAPAVSLAQFNTRAPIATTRYPGLVQPDGTTCTVTLTGVLSCGGSGPAFAYPSGTGLVRVAAGTAWGTTAELSGDAVTSGSNVVTNVGINGVLFSTLATGPLCNTTTTGVPSACTAAAINTLLQGLTGCNTVTNVLVPQSGTCVPPGGGALILLEEHTASASATLNFTAWYSTSYDDYQIEFVNVVPTVTNGYMYMQMGSGSCDSGNNYTYAGFNMVKNATSSFGSDSGGNQLLITGSPGNISTSASQGVIGTVMLYNPGSTAVVKRVRSHIGYLDSSSENFAVEQTGSWVTSGTAANQICIVNSAGTIASGTIRIYGLTH